MALNWSYGEFFLRVEGRGGRKIFSGGLCVM